MLNKAQAKNIIKHLADIVYDNIFIINTDGLVIGSNLEETIGTYDETAKIVNNTKMPYIQNNADNSKLYLPIFIDNELVIVVGLNGSFNTIGKYGEFAVKITEILCMETLYNERKAISVENRRNLIENILFGNEDIEIINRKLNIEGYYSLDKYKYLIVVSRLEDTINKRFDEKIFSYTSKTDLYAVFHNKYIILTTIGTSSELKSRMDYIYKDINKKIVITVSNELTNDTSLYNEYNKLTVLNDFYSSGNNFGKYYADKVDLELLIWNVNPELRLSYVNRIFTKFSQSDIIELKKIVIQLVKNNGRLDSTSKNLFVHINTLNYRINKLSLKYGESIKDYRVLMELYIALMVNDFK